VHVPYNVSLDVHLLESCEESLEEASGFAAILKNADIFQCYDKLHGSGYNRASAN